MPSRTDTPWLLRLCVLACTLAAAHAHGRMVLPPSRATAWRLGVPGAPVNYNDNQAFCGGRAHQYKVNGGRCGICGDPWDQRPPRDHERPDGKFVMRTGFILSTFREGQVLTASIQITAAHLGFFEFYLCSVDSLPGNAEEATPECLKQNRLYNLNNNSYQYTFQQNVAMKHLVRLQLPPGLKCNHCVLQWRYHTGNSWDAGCLGCGEQEEFYSCSDISILGRNEPVPTPSVAPPVHWTPTPPTKYIPPGVDPDPLSEADKEFFLCNFCFSNSQTAVYSPVCFNFKYQISRGSPHRRCSRLGK